VAYSFEIADLANTVLADITGIAMEKRLAPRLNRAGQATFKTPLYGTTPAGVDVSSILLPDAGDGYPTLCTGNRRLIVKKNGVAVPNVGNTYIWTVERAGGPSDAYADVVCFNPMIRWPTRWAQDADGSIVDGVVDDLSDPDFGKPILDLPAGAVNDDALPVSGGDLIQQMIENTIANNGPLGLTTSGGTFDTTIPPAADVSFALTDWPTKISDLATLLFAAGVVDVVLDSVTAAGEPMAVLSAVNQAGSDLTATVSFDWQAGLFNASHARHVESMDEFANVIRYFLGPRVRPNRWRGSIDATTSGITTDPTASRSVYGDYVDFPIYDSRGTENTVRKIYMRLFDSELAYRMVPRTTIGITPQAGVAPEPFTDYNLGDVVNCNIGSNLGLELVDAAIRVFGIDITITDEGVERVGELLLMQDA